MEYMKEIIKRLADSVPEQIKVNIDAQYDFDKDNKELIDAFAKLDIALRDENGSYRNTYDVLKDMSCKYEQLYGQNNQ